MSCALGIPIPALGGFSGLHCIFTYLYPPTCLCPFSSLTLFDPSMNRLGYHPALSSIFSTPAKYYQYQVLGLLFYKRHASITDFLLLSLLARSNDCSKWPPTRNPAARLSMIARSPSPLSTSTPMTTSMSLRRRRLYTVVSRLVKFR